MVRLNVKLLSVGTASVIRIVQMKNSIILAILGVVLFVIGLLAGASLGIASGANSNSTELYNSTLQLSTTYQLIENGEHNKAKQFICDAVKTRIQLLEIGQVIVKEQRALEIDNLKRNLVNIFDDSHFKADDLENSCQLVTQ